jgi:hypothetical protein
MCPRTEKWRSNFGCIPAFTTSNFTLFLELREVSPANNQNHFIDENDNYHINETGDRIYPNCYAQGFLIQTRNPGRYPVRLEVITDCGEGIPTEKLYIIVEER